MRMVLAGRWRSLLVSVLFASAGCSGSAADPTAPLAPTDSSPDVQAILSAMKARYRDAKTYSDEGTLRVVFEPGRDKEHVTSGRFKTRWVAPDRLSFALQEESLGVLDEAATCDLDSEAGSDQGALPREGRG